MVRGNWDRGMHGYGPDWGWIPMVAVMVAVVVLVVVKPF